MKVLVFLMLLKNFAGFDRRYDFLRALNLSTALLKENETRKTLRKAPADSRWINRFCRNQNLENLTNKYPVINKTIVEQIASQAKLKVNVWVQRNVNCPLRLEFEVAQENPAHELNLFSADFDKFSNLDFSNMSLIIDIQKFATKRSYDPRNNMSPKREMTFMQAVVSEIHPKLCGFDFYAKCEEYKKKWGSTEFSFYDVQRFYQTFGIGLQIFTLRIEKDGRKRLNKKFDTLWKRKLSLQLPKCNTCKPLNWNQMVEYIRSPEEMNYFECPHNFCFFVTNRIRDLEKHKSSCKEESEIIYEQVKYEVPDKSTKKELFSEGILPSVDFVNTMFSTFDIESSMLPEEDFSASYRSVHRVSTIAVYNNFGDRKSYFMFRENMTATALKSMMSEFLAVLDESQQNMVRILPDSIRKGFFKYVAEVQNPLFKTLSPSAKSSARRKLSYLQSLLSLRSYSWNGEAYDLPCLVGPLLERLALNTEAFRKLKVIKRNGGSYMEIRFGFIIMRDFINHSVPMTLEKFGLSCEVKEFSKAIYPYELFYNMLDVREARTFPRYSDFNSTLAKNNYEDHLEELRFLIEKGLRNKQFEHLLDVEEFFGWRPAFLKDVFSVSQGKVIVEDSCKLSDCLETSPTRFAASKWYFEENCVTMLDFLEWYNLIDCKLLSASIEKYAEGFLQSWNVNVHEFISLPSLAQHLALESFSPDAYPIYSFNSKYGFLNEEIRSQLSGGMVQVFNRLQKVKPFSVPIEEDKYPKSVHFTPNGKRIQKIEFFDFNSLVSLLLEFLKLSYEKKTIN